MLHFVCLKQIDENVRKTQLINYQIHKWSVRVCNFYFAWTIRRVHTSTCVNPIFKTIFALDKKELVFKNVLEIQNIKYTKTKFGQYRKKVLLVHFMCSSLQQH